jgi:hypothetical protein
LNISFEKDKLGAKEEIVSCIFEDDTALDSNSSFATMYSWYCS